ncbi:MAG: prepilin-type N-terminal cleavage/methylation domain-containing protein [Pseudoxanthomonas sp.]
MTSTRRARHAGHFPRSGKRRARGFTLIEVIIAFALLALALTLLLGSLSGAARQVRNADDAGRATLHAQSLLAQLGVGDALRPDTQQGVFEQGRYRWALDIKPYVDPPNVAILKPRVLEGNAPRLLQVQLSVAWGDDRGQRLQWQTLRLAPADINQPVPVP